MITLLLNLCHAVVSLTLSVCAVHLQVQTVFLVHFSRCCSQTRLSVRLSSRTITWWLSCRNVSPALHFNWKQTCAFLSFVLCLRITDLHVLLNFPKVHIPTLEILLLLTEMFSMFHCLSLLNSVSVVSGFVVEHFMFNKWKGSSNSHSDLF